LGFWPDTNFPHPRTAFYLPARVPSHGGAPGILADTMVNVALFVRLEAKPGKEAEITAFLKGGLSLVMEEPATTGSRQRRWGKKLLERVLYTKYIQACQFPEPPFARMFTESCWG
jgi:hypothetical protein